MAEDIKLNISAAANYLGIAISTLRKWNKGFPKEMRARKVGASYEWTLDQLDQIVVLKGLQKRVNPSGILINLSKMILDIQYHARMTNQRLTAIESLIEEINEVITHPEPQKKRKM